MGTELTGRPFQTAADYPNMAGECCEITAESSTVTVCRHKHMLFCRYLLHETSGKQSIILSKSQTIAFRKFPNNIAYGDARNCTRCCKPHTCTPSTVRLAAQFSSASSFSHIAIFGSSFHLLAHSQRKGANLGPLSAPRLSVFMQHLQNR